MAEDFFIDARWQALAREIGLDESSIFDHPQVHVWRKLSDRENCTLDAEIDSKPVRLHIKRYPAGVALAREEVRALELLQRAEIPTITLAGWGEAPDGRSFIITEDLHDFHDSEKLVQAGLPFDRLLVATANLAARLHETGLHHRDLYLCHFFARLPEDASREPELRLIDVARVRRLPRIFARRWIVKDLAQFLYSTTSLPVTDEQRRRWLTHYAEVRRVRLSDGLQRAIDRKVRWIAAHDEKLKRSQPARNVSIPAGGSA